MALLLVVRYVGVALAMVGTFAAAPGTASELLRGSRRALKRPLKAVRSRVAMWRTGRRAAVDVNVIGSPATSTSSAHGGHIELSGGGTVDLLAKRLDRVASELAELRTEFRTRVGGLDAQIEQTDHRIADVAEDIRLYRAESHQADLRALPLVGVGILLCSVPNQLVQFRWMNIALLIIAAGAVAWYVRPRWA